MKVSLFIFRHQLFISNETFPSTLFDIIYFKKSHHWKCNHLKWCRFSRGHKYEKHYKWLRLPEPLNLETSYKVILYFFLTRALWVKKKRRPRLKQKRSIDFKILVNGRSSLFNHTLNTRLVKHELHWVENDIIPPGQVPLWSALSLVLVPYHYNLFPQGYTVCEAGTK